MCLYPDQPKERFQNLAYYYHHVEHHGQIKIDHKDFNKLYILSKMLDLGQSYHNTEGKIINKSNQSRYRDSFNKLQKPKWL